MRTFTVDSSYTLPPAALRLFYVLVPRCSFQLILIWFVVCYRWFPSYVAVLLPLRLPACRLICHTLPYTFPFCPTRCSRHRSLALLHTTYVHVMRLVPTFAYITVAVIAVWFVRVTGAVSPFAIPSGLLVPRLYPPLAFIPRADLIYYVPRLCTYPRLPFIYRVGSDVIAFPLPCHYTPFILLPFCRLPVFPLLLQLYYPHGVDSFLPRSRSVILLPL